MTLGPNGIEDRVLQAFLDLLAGQREVPPPVLQRLATLLREEQRWSSDEVSKIIRDGVRDYAQD